MGCPRGKIATATGLADLSSAILESGSNFRKDFYVAVE